MKSSSESASYVTRTGERGVIGFFVVFFVVIMIGVWIVVAVRHADMLDAERLKKDLLEKEALEQEKWDRWQKYLDPLTQPVGWEKKDGQLPIKDVVDHLDKHRKDMLRLLLKEDPAGLPPDSLLQTKEFKTIEQLILPYYSVGQFAKARLEEAKKWKEREETRISAIRPLEQEKDKFWIKEGTKTEYLKMVEDRISKLNQGKIHMEEDFKAKIQEIEKLIEEQKTEEQVETGKYDQKRQELEIEMKKLKEKIETMLLNIETRHFSVTSYVATIANVDLINNLATINIGARKRVKQGMRFFIAKFGDAGKFDFKAEIEVQRAFDDFSQVKITAIYNKEKPPLTGDYIVNPFFHPHRPLKVAFVGRKDPQLKINLDEAKRRIRQLGNLIIDSITSDLDFIIVTREDEGTKIEHHPMFQKAVSFGIPIGFADDLFNYLIFK